jgi:DNA-binding beta-propeller fold protein YncE
MLKRIFFKCSAISFSLLAFSGLILQIVMSKPALAAAATNVVYVTNAASGTVSEIDVSTNTPSIINTINLPSGAAPSSIAITPNGTTAYVTDNTNNVVYPID